MKTYYLNGINDLIDDLVKCGYDPTIGYENVAVGLRVEFSTDTYTVYDEVTGSALRNLEVQKTYMNDEGEIWVYTNTQGEFNLGHIE